MIWWLVLAVAVIAAFLVAARVAFRPPSIRGRPHSRALPASGATTLGRAVAALCPTPGSSGAIPLWDGRDALAARIALIQAAQQSIDLQYYVWQRDATGLQLLGEVQKAADRGVRVRLLLDDNGIAALDADLAALNAHPWIEVRLFNPFILRRARYLGFLFDFSRLNRRMHNKSFTVDGAVTIVGGRNVGDIYFAYGDGVHYIDTDVIGIGAIAADVAADFDRYWISGSSHPAERILAAPRADAWQDLAAAAADAAATERWRAYGAGLGEGGPVADLLAGRADIECVPIRLVSDHPAKGLGRARREQLLYPRLTRLIGSPQRSLDVVSPYFVPGRGFTRSLVALARRGRRVRVLTNSQAATDVLVVHSAYVRYRRRLLEAGVALHELKPNAATPPPRAERDIRRRTVIGSARASLHAKSLCIDGERVFIGSFNFDHRSLDLNTEMGILIDSPRMARRFDDGFAQGPAAQSYRPQLQGKALVWDDPGPPPAVLRVEPETTIFTRALLAFLGLLPFEWLL